jgi:hypothetical protein
MRFVALILIFAACGGDDGGGSSTPDAKTVDAYFSECGHPGDMGNELGIGKFCGNGLSDCADTPSAPLCSSLGSSTTHFCTKTCPMGSTDACGTGAECTCNGNNQCGCTPSVCLGP